MGRLNIRSGRLGFLLGLAVPWFLTWLVLGLRFLLILGKDPHPFLTHIQVTGTLLGAVVSWAGWALLSYLVLGALFGLVLRGCALAGSPKPHPAPTFRSGFRLGWVGILLSHGLLWVLTPIAMATLPVLRRVPLGPLLVVLLLGGLFVFWRGLPAHEAAPKRAFRTLAAVVAVFLILLIPHDVFRRSMPRPRALQDQAPRLLVLGIDGLREDVLEQFRPEWKPPKGVSAVCSLPATRLAWNILLGANPEGYTTRVVIPYRSELAGPPATRLINEASAKGISTAFLIDDSTTLSFGISSAPFAEVLEPSGGWKHFFTVGAGTCWPVYSWIENYLSPIETTNPWSDPQAYYRDIDRALQRHQWVSAHTCQLHAPFYLRLKELHAFNPWKWLGDSARQYECYQSMDQAERDHFSRKGGKANAAAQYAVRVGFLAEAIDPWLKRWASRYPSLSGILTADHGEEHFPVVDDKGKVVSYLTGIHGFDLDVGSARIPLHPFGVTKVALPQGVAYSWLDLRYDLHDWVHHPGPLSLKSFAPEGRLLHFPTIQAIHTMPKEVRDKGKIEGAGLTPQDLVTRTYLTSFGAWWIDDPSLEERSKVMSTALVSGSRMVTLNPLNEKTWIRRDWNGYTLLNQTEHPVEEAEKEIQAFQGRRPEPLPPCSQ